MQIEKQRKKTHVRTFFFGDFNIDIVSAECKSCTCQNADENGGKIWKNRSCIHVATKFNSDVCFRWCDVNFGWRGANYGIQYSQRRMSHKIYLEWCQCHYCTVTFMWRFSGERKAIASVVLFSRSRCSLLYIKCIIWFIRPLRKKVCGISTRQPWHHLETTCCCIGVTLPYYNDHVKRWCWRQHWQRHWMFTHAHTHTVYGTNRCQCVQLIHRQF